MEDSLEGYIKISQNTLEGRKKKHETKEVRKEVLITLQRKTECQARAMKIVEFLIEGKLRPEVFLRCMKHIDQSYYQDVVEERALSKLCGYSLCGEQIPDMPKKQYFIDTKKNKVYDIADRKNYCSNFCYKASVHIKQQIDNSPLWLRKLEDCPKFKLLPSTERGVPGEEVNQGIAKPIKDSTFTSVTSFTEMSLREIDEMEVKKVGKKGTKKDDKKPEVMETLHESDESTATTTIIDDDNQLSSSTNETQISKESHRKPDVKCEIIPPLVSGNTHVKSVEQNKLSEKIKEKIETTSNIAKIIKPKKKGEVVKDVLRTIKMYVHEWITLETYVFLYGEAKVQELLDEKQLQEYFESLKIAESTATQQRKYLEICRKLNLNELAEGKFDRAVIGTKLKPVPDYKKLKKESKMMDLKVRSFYSGVPHKSVGEIKEKTEKHLSNENDAATDDSPAVLPLVETHSQNAIRRRIYLNSINKAMVNLTQSLGIHPQCVVDDLQLLVKTFKLQAHNVVFAPAVRTFIAFILIKILSIRNHGLKEQLETKQSQIFIKVMLSHFPNAQAFLNDLFASIEDVNTFVKQYFTESENC